MYAHILQTYNKQEFHPREMKVKDVVKALERFAPLPLQESYDNAGLQIGLTEEQEVSGVLLCLDVTEDILHEAIETDCNLVVSHHPLFFRPIRKIASDSMVGRCAQIAISNNIAVYSAHTNLDNAKGGVNYEIAQKLRLENVTFLKPINSDNSGSGAIGDLPGAMQCQELLDLLANTFKVKAIMHNDGSCDWHATNGIKRVALCGGAGDFLLEEAIKQGAQAFITGEMGYHRYFGHEKDILIAVLGHYQSEQFTIDLLERILLSDNPTLRILKTKSSTNPIFYELNNFSSY